MPICFLNTPATSSKENTKLHDYRVKIQIEALCIAAAIKHFSLFIVQSLKQSQVPTVSKPCVEAIASSAVVSCMHTCTSLTTESSVCAMQLHIWHCGSLHSKTRLLAKSEDTFAKPARCWMLIWYQLASKMNVVILRLDEN